MRLITDFAAALAFAAGIAACTLAIDDANAAPSFKSRAAAFFSSIRESATEYNCQPRVCRAKAARQGLTFNARTFEACDAREPRRCALPSF